MLHDYDINLIILNNEPKPRNHKSAVILDLVDFYKSKFFKFYKVVDGSFFYIEK